MCRVQLGKLYDKIEAMKDLGFEILAVSRDDKPSARLMAAMLDSKITVLSDPSMEMIRAYRMKGEGMEMADLGYVVIDVQGRIRARKIDRKFGENAQDLIRVLKRLKAEA